MKAQGNARIAAAVVVDKKNKKKELSTAFVIDDVGSISHRKYFADEITRRGIRKKAKSFELSRVALS